MSNYDSDQLPTKHYFLLGVKLIVVNEHGKILLLKRSGESSRPHSWDFPGGGVDAGESFEFAAKRELYEETGLGLYDLQPLGSVYTKENDLDNAIIFGFCAKTDQAGVTLSSEHESYE